MDARPQLGSSGKVVVAFALTTVGGFVDAVGYIALFQIFTANMSGNSIHVGMGLASGTLAELLRPLCAVASYIAGMTLTRVLLEIALRRDWQRIASVTLACEALLLVAFASATPHLHNGQIVDMQSVGYFALVSTLAFAMGVQTATLTHQGSLTVYTTFVTGTLTKFSESFTRALFWIHDQFRSGEDTATVLRRAKTQPDVRSCAFLFFIWMCYVIGAALGMLTKQKWELKALYLPVGVLLTLITLDRVRAISGEEEQHQHGGGRSSG